MSYVGVVTFGNAWAEYVRCTPSAMEHQLVIVDRPDTEGIDLKQYPRKPEAFYAYCVIMDTSRGGVINRVRQWQALQGNTIGTLNLPHGYIPNCALTRVRRLHDIKEMAQATNNCTHRQGLVLQFLQTEEGE